MDIKATVASGYRNRLLIIALGTLFFSAYAVYDATVSYPKQLKQYTAYRETIEQNPEGWDKIWLEKAKANGWDEQPDERSQGDIHTQWVLFGITFPIGAYCLVSMVLWSKRYLGADDDLLYASGGVEVPYDKITRVDAARWESKGIARVTCETDSGEQVILIDDWKYQREPTTAVFKKIQEHVSADKIHGLVEQPTADEPADPEDPAEPAVATEPRDQQSPA